jgi:hypothetical protein
MLKIEHRHLLCVIPSVTRNLLHFLRVIPNVTRNLLS